MAALAWNDAIKALFAAVFGENGTIFAMFVYAIVVTLVAVWAIIKIAKMEEKAKEKYTIEKED